MHEFLTFCEKYFLSILNTFILMLLLHDYILLNVYKEYSGAKAAIFFLEI